MQHSMSMSSLHCGQSAVIQALRGRGAMYERLFDLGFTPGSSVTCLYAAVFGDPKAYLIKQTVIALRKKDADMVECTVSGGGSV